MAAQRAAPTGHVLATDISASMLKLASDAAREAGLTNLEARVVDAENIDLDANSFDAVICQLGLMVFPDPMKVLAAMRRVLRTGRKIATVVFSTAERNPIKVLPRPSLVTSEAQRHRFSPSEKPTSLKRLSARAACATLSSFSRYISAVTTRPPQR